jgi:hypothetical protein
MQLNKNIKFASYLLQFLVLQTCFFLFFVPNNFSTSYKVDRTLSSGGKSTLDAFAAGTQYLILDAGGKNVTI